MAESLSVRRSFRIEWKVRNIFPLNSVESREFSFGGSRCVFRLTAYGIGETERVVVYLFRKNSNETPLNEIRVDVYIEDRNGKPQFTMARSTSDGEVMVWNEYASKLRGEVIFSTTGVVKFVCTLVLESIPIPEDEFEKEMAAQTDMNLETLASLECLAVDFRHLLDDSSLSDVTLKCGAQSIPVHKIVLSARSEVLRDMLRSATSDFRKNIIEIPDMGPETLVQFVEYIYSGKLPHLSSDNAKQLYAAADSFAFHALKRLCGKFMKKKLTKTKVST